MYASPHTRQEVEKLLLHEIKTHKNFKLASVKGDYGEDIYSLIRMLYCLTFQKIFDCNELKSVLFRNFIRKTDFDKRKQA